MYVATAQKGYIVAKFIILKKTIKLCSYLHCVFTDEKKSSKGTGPKPNFRQRKNRKTGLTTVELQTIFPELNEPAPDETTTTKS